MFEQDTTASTFDLYFNLLYSVYSIPNILLPFLGTSSCRLESGVPNILLPFLGTPPYRLAESEAAPLQLRLGIILSSWCGAWLLPSPSHLCSLMSLLRLCRWSPGGQRGHAGVHRGVLAAGAAGPGIDCPRVQHQLHGRHATRYTTPFSHSQIPKGIDE
jgi:hypothetical protein